MKYFYTFKLPFTKKTKFTYWKAESSDECLSQAFKLYKTSEFYIEETTKQNYCHQMGINVEDPVNHMAIDLRAGNGGFILRLKDRNGGYAEMEINTKRRDKAEAVAKALIGLIESETTEIVKIKE